MSCLLVHPVVVLAPVKTAVVVVAAAAADADDDDDDDDDANQCDVIAPHLEHLPFINMGQSSTSKLVIFRLP